MIKPIKIIPSPNLALLETTVGQHVPISSA